MILDYFNRRPVNFAHTSHDGTPILKIDRGFLFTFAAALLIFIAGCTNANSEPQKSKEKAAGVIPDESVGSSPKNAPSTASPSNDALSKDSVPASVSSPQTAPTDWLQFRGAGNLSTTSSQGLPSEFNENHVTWKAELLGRGCSTPIIVGNRVLLTSYSGYGESAAKPGALDLFLLHLYCYDRETGELFWRKDIKGNPAENPRLNPNLLGHGFASSTPVSDGKNVYAFFGVSGVFAFDLDGNFLWQQDVGWRNFNFGSSSSLAIHQDTLIVNASIESQTVYGLDKKTGKGIWKIDDVLESWATPTLGLNDQGDSELVIPQKDIIRGFDPKTGKELWTCEAIPDYIVPTPVIVNGVAYCNGGKESRSLAIRLGGRGDVTKSHKLWQARIGTNVTSSIYHNEHLYQIYENGVFQVLDSKTGQTVNRGRVKGATKVFGSPLLAGEKLYIPLLYSVAVVAAKPEYELISMNNIAEDEGEFRASIAVSGDRMFTRNDKFLYSVSPEKVAETKIIKQPLPTNASLASKAKFDFDQSTKRIRIYNRCVGTDKTDLEMFILTPYKSVITEDQTTKSKALITEWFPRFAEIRRERSDVVWRYLTHETDDAVYQKEMAAIETKVMALQRDLRAPVKKMFSKEQMDQHIAESNAWLEKNKKNQKK